MATELCQTYNLYVARGGINGFMPFPKLSKRIETKTASLILTGLWLFYALWFANEVHFPFLFIFWVILSKESFLLIPFQ